MINIWPFNRIKKQKNISEPYERYIRYPNEDSPWKIEKHVFQNGDIGYQIWVLRVDTTYNRWANIFNPDLPGYYSNSKVIFDIYQSELMEILKRDFDVCDTWISLMFSTIDEAKRFIDEYSHHYDTTYIGNVLIGVI